MDAAVPLARRLRHYLNAAVEDLLASHDELRLAAAEERGEERAEVPVHAVESLAQQLACLAVDLADRVLERFHRLLEVGRLRIEVALALAARAQLLHRRQVHGTELTDRLGNARDLALQRGGTRRTF